MSGRPLRYPYTMGAMLMQFPYKFHYQNNWVYKSWVWGMAVTVPIMCYITYKQSGSKPAPKKDASHH